MNILITGCAGFIGSHLTERLLSLGHNIIGMYNFDIFYDRKIKENNISFSLEKKKFKLHQIDITNSTSLNDIFIQNKIDIVIHLAAKAGVKPSLNDPLGYYNTNVIGT